MLMHNTMDSGPRGAYSQQAVLIHLWLHLMASLNQNCFGRWSLLRSHDDQLTPCFGVYTVCLWNHTTPMAHWRIHSTRIRNGSTAGNRGNGQCKYGVLGCANACIHLYRRHAWLAKVAGRNADGADGSSFCFGVPLFTQRTCRPR